ncbi:MAG: anti-sigma factor antagonist [Acidobacteria bacterium]|nr:MAG: anti-sigma factor antagonist [Acidobacteriota bacterium]
MLTCFLPTAYCFLPTVLTGGSSVALEIVEKESHGATLLVLSGQVKIGEESNRLRDKLRELLGKGKTCLVLDLGDVDYIDSSGLGTLVSTFSTATRYGGTIKLANLTKRFREQLSITKLVTVFDVYDSAEEAAKSFQ